MRKNKPSASSLFRLALCPASWQAESRCPAPPASPAAATGTALHAHMENGTDPEDSNEAEALLWCRTQESLLLESLLGTTSPTTHREQRLWAADESFSGQADVIYIHGSAALIVDYKFGRNPVEPAESNWQLRALSLLTLQNFATVDTVYSTILQPFLSRTTPTCVSYTRSQLSDLSAAVKSALEAANSPSPAFSPSLHACRYCRALPTCPAASQHAHSIEQYHTWQLLPLSDRAELYHRAQLAKKLAADVESLARADLESGLTLPGLKLKTGNTVRKLAFTDQLTALCNTHDIAPEDYCTPSLAKLEKVYQARLKAKGNKCSLDQAKKAIATLIPESITASQNAPSIVSE